MFKPFIVVSRCLGFEACRYDGQMKSDELVNKLKPYSNLITVCPETAIGLGTPRKPIRIEKYEDGLHLIQPSTGKDFSKEMNIYSLEYLEDLHNIDGFILKSKSPSCGVKDTKIYPKNKNLAITYKDYGMFARNIHKIYPYLPLESNNRLKDYNIRKKFLTNSFTSAWFKNAYSKQDIDTLKEFHIKNRLLLSIRSNQSYIELYKILNSGEKTAMIFKAYKNRLLSILSKNPRKNSSIVLLNYLSGELKNIIQKEEHNFLEETIIEYGKNLIPIEVPLSIIKSHALAHDIKAIYEQSIFNPYPKELDVSLNR